MLEALIDEVDVLVLLHLMSSLDSVFAGAGWLDSQQFSSCFRPKQDARSIRNVSNAHLEPVVTVLVVSKVETDDPVMSSAQSFGQPGRCNVLVDGAAFPDKGERLGLHDDSRVLLVEVMDAADE